VLLTYKIMHLAKLSSKFFIEMIKLVVISLLNSHPTTPKSDTNLQVFQFTDVKHKTTSRIQAALSTTNQPITKSITLLSMSIPTLSKLNSFLTIFRFKIGQKMPFKIPLTPTIPKSIEITWKKSSLCLSILYIKSRTVKCLI
jgi:hypothetical protein